MEVEAEVAEDRATTNGRLYDLDLDPEPGLTGKGTPSLEASEWEGVGLE